MNLPGITITSGCEHFSGEPNDPTRDLQGEAVARSEGMCLYCKVPLEALPLGPYCNCCWWFWLLPRGGAW